MNEKVYLETSFISYLTGRISTNLVVAGYQQITQEWWANHRHKFDLYISELVLREASTGDKEAAAKRLAILQDLPELEMVTEVAGLADQFIRQNALPENALTDAFHIAITCVHHMDYLLTWNFKHIANAQMHRHIREVSHKQGCELPIICTPQELLGE